MTGWNFSEYGSKRMMPKLKTSASRARRVQRQVSLNGLFLETGTKLENRQLMAANVLTVKSFSPVSGPTVQVNYELTPQAGQTTSVTFDIYRSGNAVYDAADKKIGSQTATAATGQHLLEMNLGKAMRPDPSRPYIIVVGRANGPVQETETGDNSAVFRKYSIGVISHGGIQGSHINIPQWEAKIGWKLQDYGYDVVIPFNWAGQSKTPGAAAQQGPRLAKKIENAIAALPAGAVVDLDYIGHSEGSVVVSQAAIYLQKHPSANLNAGYSRMTLLDPHAANPEAPNNAESVSGGFTGWLTRRVISWYKGNARDPLVQVPPNINEADVYYQRTPLSVNPVNHGLYNLLGQVPVIGTARYIQLNSPGIAHSGGGGVYSWFYFNALPAFATGDQPKNPSILQADSISTNSGSWNRKQFVNLVGTPTYNGVATPGATVKLYFAGGSGKVENSRAVATTTADASGHWHLQPDAKIHGGTYQVSVRAFLPCGLPREHRQLMPTIRLGSLKYHPSSQVKSQINPSLVKINYTIPKSLNKNGIGLRLTDLPQTFDPKHRVRP